MVQGARFYPQRFQLCDLSFHDQGCRRAKVYVSTFAYLSITLSTPPLSKRRHWYGIPLLLPPPACTCKRNSPCLGEHNSDKNSFRRTGWGHHMIPPPPFTSLSRTAEITARRHLATSPTPEMTLRYAFSSRPSARTAPSSPRLTTTNSNMRGSSLKPSSPPPSRTPNPFPLRG
jgi:hypothetical protein